MDQCAIIGDVFDQLVARSPKVPIDESVLKIHGSTEYERNTFVRSIDHDGKDEFGLQPFFGQSIVEVDEFTVRFHVGHDLDQGDIHGVVALRGECRVIGHAVLLDVLLVFLEEFFDGSKRHRGMHVGAREGLGIRHLRDDQRRCVEVDESFAFFLFLGQVQVEGGLMFLDDLADAREIVNHSRLNESRFEWTTHIGHIVLAGEMIFVCHGFNVMLSQVIVFVMFLFFCQRYVKW
mmetsp:Transcript_30485/g.65398  ORF Transcript_30485/g.65398 Transcript_30485/m.65398 type:complete len:234 (-) Transcript_30485:1-702(-)